MKYLNKKYKNKGHKKGVYGLEIKWQIKQRKKPIQKINKINIKIKEKKCFINEIIPTINHKTFIIFICLMQIFILFSNDYFDDIK